MTKLHPSASLDSNAPEEVLAEPWWLAALGGILLGLLVLLGFWAF